VPRTGFEPAHRLRRYHLKVVCLPISPPGQGFSIFSTGDKCMKVCLFNQPLRILNKIPKHRSNLLPYHAKIPTINPIMLNS
jgi:hypothetical protein